MISIAYVYLLFVIYTVAWIYFSWDDLVRDYYNFILFKVDFHLFIRLLFYLLSYFMPLIVFLIIN